MGVLLLLKKVNLFKFPRNPYYRCMLELNNLPAELSLILSKESFKSAILGTIPNTYIKVLQLRINVSLHPISFHHIMTFLWPENICTVTLY